MASKWYQQALTPPEVIEGNIRIGVIGETDHCQVLIELKDPLTGVLIAQESWPHDRAANARALLEEAANQLANLVEQTLEPF